MSVRLCALTLTVLSGCAQTPPATKPLESPRDHVLVVVNRLSPESLRIGRYYAQKRGIPAGNLLEVESDTAEEIPSATYAEKIERPVREALKAHREGIDYIVLTKGVPIRVREGGFSVDGQLAAMEVSIPGISGDRTPEPSDIPRGANPYFGKRFPFHHEAGGLYLVTRLDGLTVEDALALVDRSMAAKPVKGPFFFDEAANRKTETFGELQAAMDRAAALLGKRGLEATVENTEKFVTPPTPVAGYVSWGSNDGAFSAEAYRKVRFLPGAIAETFVSTSGRTFLPTTGGQSLITDLIKGKGGVTGVKGYVSEPYTFALARPDILFERYTAGFNLAESFYMASPVIRWKDVVIGDPLCRPYPHRMAD